MRVARRRLVLLAAVLLSHLAAISPATPIALAGLFSGSLSGLFWPASAHASNSAEEDLLTDPDSASRTPETVASSDSAAQTVLAAATTPEASAAELVLPTVVVGGIVLVAILAAVVLVIWWRRRGGGADGPAKRPEALLKDLMNVTGLSEIAITEDAVVFGRLSTNSGPGVQGVTLPINTVGRRHAQIEYRQHAFYVSDLQSRNGTLVNGNRIEGSTILHNGDVIQIEGVQFVFALPDESLGDETQLVGSRGAPEAAVGITVAPGFEAAAAAGGGSLIEMYGGEASDTGGVLDEAGSSSATEILAPPQGEAVTEQPALDKTVALNAPANAAPADDPQEVLTEAFEAVTETPQPVAADAGFPGLMETDDGDDADSTPTAALDGPAAGHGVRGTVADAPPAQGLIAAYSGTDEDDSSDEAPTQALTPEGGGLIAAYGGEDDDTAGDESPTGAVPSGGGGLIAAYGGTDDDPEEQSPTAAVEPPASGMIAAYSADDTGSPAAAGGGLIDRFGVDSAAGEPSPSAPTIAPPPPAEQRPAGGGLIAQFGGRDEEPLPAGSGIEARYADTADEELLGSDSPTSMLDGPGEGGGFELLLDESDTHENLPIAAAYAETGDMEPLQSEPPLAEDERTADVLRNAAQSVPGVMPAPDLEDTGASPRIDRAYLEAQGLISNANLPPAVPSAPVRAAPPRRPDPPPMRPERAMPEPPSSGGQGVPLPLAFLIDRDGGTAVSQYQIETDNLFVGRSVPTQVQARSYFSIPSKTIGRKHASIRYARGRFWVEDHKSINGTYVNGERVIGMAPLESGDEICFDTFRFGFLVMADGGSNGPEDADKTVFSGGR